VARPLRDGLLVNLSCYQKVCPQLLAITLHTCFSIVVLASFNAADRDNYQPVSEEQVDSLYAPEPATARTLVAKPGLNAFIVSSSQNPLQKVDGRSFDDLDTYYESSSVRSLLPIRSPPRFVTEAV
jgi:hypothetical protein